MITQESLDKFMAPKQGANAPTLVIPAPVQAETLSTPLQEATRQGAIEQFERMQELEATPMSTALSASVKNWDTTQLFDAAINKPTFQVDPNFKPNEALQNVQFPVTEDDRTFLFKSKSMDEFNWRTQQLQEMRDRSELARTAPVMNAVVQFADPLYLATDLLSMGAGTALKLGRIGTAAIGAATTAATMATVGSEARPVSDNEIIFAAALHGAATAAVFKPAKAERSLADMSPEEFAAEMQRRNGIDPNNPPQFDPNNAMSPLAMSLGVGPRGAVVTDEVPAAIRDAAQRGLDLARRGEQTNPKRPWLEWSLYKTFSGHSEDSKALADRLLDDPLNPNATSAAAIQRETQARFGVLLNQYEDTLRVSLANQGWGNLRRFYDPVGYRRAQQEFESAVRMELDKRMIDPNFRGANTDVANAVDRLGEYSRAVGKELERKGMVEPGFVEKNPYYYPRRMNVAKVEEAERLLGKKAFMKQMTTAVQRGLSSDRPTANVIAHAMVERARRKGYGIDNSGHIINKEGRDELLEIINNAKGFDEAAKARASALLRPAGEDAGRPSMLKARINIDMMHQLGPNLQVRDLFDDSITSMMDSYNRRITGRLALHEAGLGTDAERAAAREALAKSIADGTKRREALQQYDNIVNYYMGAPVGEEMPQFMRQLSALTQATGLAASGLWQLVEYGTMMQRFGAMNTFKAMLRTLPEARALLKQMKVSAKDGRQLALDTEEALTAAVAGDIRMRPILQHYDDMFSADKSPWVMRLEHARDATMFINMQKYIHFHQTRTNAALVMQTLRKAAEGDAKAIAAMKTYGANDALLADVRKEVAKSGTKPESWDEGVFNRTRTVMMNAMDDAIVRARVGELPAFAEFSTLGKFLFTFRRFVAATHNKTLVGTWNRDGARGMATLMAYQFPLAMMATAANNVISGKAFKDPTTMTPGKLAGQALNYIGAIGFASEFTGVLTGQQRSFGAPGLLFLDRMYGVAGATTGAAGNLLTGDTDQAVNDARRAAGNIIQALPLISIVPGVRALNEAVKGE
ncbi:internal virion protein [Escherichia phage Lidtsur]|uniref:Internal virion protein n=1 Tax=Escherichia phage Lidtsur TaxID=2562235 RepID=A0A4D6DZ08_9CAUD|nr:internal virion protein with endolysin domain [Escherichia phage Lidtsur]QBZ71550.1 internal virion protein [Escherichia phage Lidtsur]